MYDFTGIIKIKGEGELIYEIKCFACVFVFAVILRRDVGCQLGRICAGVGSGWV